MTVNEAHLNEIIIIRPNQLSLRRAVTNSCAQPSAHLAYLTE